jgi:hypothetical protein
VTRDRWRRPLPLLDSDCRLSCGLAVFRADRITHSSCRLCSYRARLHVLAGPRKIGTAAARPLQRIEAPHAPPSSAIHLARESDTASQTAIRMRLPENLPIAALQAFVRVEGNSSYVFSIPGTSLFGRLSCGRLIAICFAFTQHATNARSAKVCAGDPCSRLGGIMKNL